MVPRRDYEEIVSEFLTCKKAYTSLINEYDALLRENKTLKEQCDKINERKAENNVYKVYLTGKECIHIQADRMVVGPELIIFYDKNGEYNAAFSVVQVKGVLLDSKQVVVAK